MRVLTEKEEQDASTVIGLRLPSSDICISSEAFNFNPVLSVDSGIERHVA